MQQMVHGKQTSGYSAGQTKTSDLLEYDAACNDVRKYFLFTDIRPPRSIFGNVSCWMNIHRLAVERTFQ